MSSLEKKKRNKQYSLPTAQCSVGEEDIQSVSVKLLMICIGAKMTGNCHITFHCCVLFFPVCKILVTLLLLVLDKLTFSSEIFHLSTPTHCNWHLIIPISQEWWQNKRVHGSCRKGFNWVWNHLPFSFCHFKHLTNTCLLVQRGIIQFWQNALTGQVEHCVICLTLKEMNSSFSFSFFFFLSCFQTLEGAECFKDYVIEATGPVVLRNQIPQVPP